MSSGALKNGYDRDRMQRRMTPVAHRSSAVVCTGTFISTSGGRKPGVPALAAWRWGRATQVEQVASWPGQEQPVGEETWDELGTRDMAVGEQWELREARNNGVRDVLVWDMSV